MSKYEPLERFLRRQTAEEVPLQFSDIERIIGSKLLPAAHAHRAWWSNNASNNVMTRSWLAAGYVSERVDIGAERVTFRRRADAVVGGVAQTGGGLLGRIRAQLGGTVKVAPGVDLTAPAGEAWDAEG